MMDNGNPTATGCPGLVHQALLYASGDEFLSGAVPFVRAGLSSAEPVLAATTATNIRLLRESLGNDADRLHFIDSSGWFPAPSWTLRDHYRYARDYLNSHSGFRLLGEPMKPGRTALENKEWARYESLLNVTFADAPVAILCPYDTRRLGREVVADAARTHPEILTAKGPQTSAEYLDPAVFSEECDRDELPEPSSTIDEHPVTLETLSSIRRLAGQQSRRLGLSPDRTEEFTMAVNEVATNAIEHGGSGTLRLWKQDHKVICDITDRAGRMEEPFPGHLPPDHSAARGRGLWMTRQLCELVQIRSARDGGCTVRLHVSLD